MEPRIHVKDAGFRYDTREIFGGLDLEVRPGEVLCVLGPNGCGKTTLLRCISGALRLHRGSILLDGEDIARLDVIALARKIGFVFQEHTASFPFPVIEVALMGRAPYLGLFGSPSAKDVELAEAALHKVGMLHARDKPYTQLSGGERQLVLIARTLAQEPEVILLDEPTSHLDFKNQALSLQLINRLSERDISMIMTTHNPNHALVYPYRVAMMNNGRIVAAGEARDMITEENLRATYGIDVRLLSASDEENGETFRFCSPRLR